MKATKDTKPTRRAGEGWFRAIARKATTTGALRIDYDFGKERYFVTSADSIGEAVIIEYGTDLETLLAEYGFDESDLSTDHDTPH